MLNTDTLLQKLIPELFELLPIEVFMLCFRGANKREELEFVEFEIKLIFTMG